MIDPKAKILDINYYCVLHFIFTLSFLTLLWSRGGSEPRGSDMFLTGSRLRDGQGQPSLTVLGCMAKSHSPTQHNEYKQCLFIFYLKVFCLGSAGGSEGRTVFGSRGASGRTREPQIHPQTRFWLLWAQDHGRLWPTAHCFIFRRVTLLEMFDHKTIFSNMYWLSATRRDWLNFLPLCCKNINTLDFLTVVHKSLVSGTQSKEKMSIKFANLSLI